MPTRYPLGKAGENGLLPKFMKDRFALRILREMYPHLKEDAASMDHAIALKKRAEEQKARAEAEGRQYEEPRGSDVELYGFVTTHPERRVFPKVVVRKALGSKLTIHDFHNTHYPDLEDDYYKNFKLPFTEVLIAMHKCAMFPLITRLDDEDKVQAERVHAAAILYQVRLAVMTRIQGGKHGPPQFDNEGKKIGHRRVTTYSVVEPFDKSVVKPTFDNSEANP